MILKKNDPAPYTGVLMPEENYRSYKNYDQFDAKLLGRDIPKPPEEDYNDHNLLIKGLACFVVGVAVGLLISPH